MTDLNSYKLSSYKIYLGLQRLYVVMLMSYVMYICSRQPDTKKNQGFENKTCLKTHPSIPLTDRYIYHGQQHDLPPKQPFPVAIKSHVTWNISIKFSISVICIWI